MDQVFSQDGENQGLHSIDFLDNQDFSKPDGQLKLGVEFWIWLVENFNTALVCFQSLFEPFSGMGGWVDDQRGSQRV